MADGDGRSGPDGFFGCDRGHGDFAAVTVRRRPDPGAASQTLRGLHRWVVAVLGLACIGVASPASWTHAAEGGDAFRRVRIIETGPLGHPNPIGLAFSPRADAFLVVGASDVGSGYTDIGIIAHTWTEDSRSARIAVGVAAPINMTFDSLADRLLIFDPGSQELIEIAAGPDGVPSSRTALRLDGRHLGPLDPKGMAVDPDKGTLFVLDVAGPRIVRIQPDPGFTQAEITEIPLWDTGLSDLRGIAFDPATGHLQVLDPRQSRLYQVTQSGVVVANRDVSAAGIVDPQAMVFAPSGDLTDDPATTSLYIADSGRREDGRTSHSTGGIAELSFSVPGRPAVAPQGATIRSASKRSRPGRAR